MRRFAAVLFALVALAASPAFAHDHSRGEAKLTLGGKAVVIEYGRPSLQGRDMLAKAEVGTTWRMGADAATTLKTDADLVFGAARVPKGSYTLTATRTDADNWTLNVEKRDPDKPREPGVKVAEAPLAASVLPESVETLTIELSAVADAKRDPKAKDRAQFEMKWGTKSLKATFGTD